MLNKTLIENILNKYDINITIQEIEKKYNEIHRYYHNIDHINFLNTKIIELYDNSIIDKKQRDILIISSLFHDIIYDPGKRDNEIKSLEFLEDRIDNNISIFEDVKRIIIDTIYHEPNEYLSIIFSDLDMYTLSNVSFEELLEIEKKLSKEFNSYDFDVYLEGRIKFLNDVLKTKYGNKNIKNIKKLINYISNYNGSEENYALLENNKMKYLTYFNKKFINISNFLLFI